MNVKANHRITDKRWEAHLLSFLSLTLIGLLGVPTTVFSETFAISKPIMSSSVTTALPDFLAFRLKHANPWYAIDVKNKTVFHIRENCRQLISYKNFDVKATASSIELYRSVGNGWAKDVIVLSGLSGGYMEISSSFRPAVNRITLEAVSCNSKSVCLGESLPACQE